MRAFRLQRPWAFSLVCEAEPYIGCPYGMPTHAHGFWVGMGAMLLFMGGHRFCASLHPTPNRSQTSRMHGIR